MALQPQQRCLGRCIPAAATATSGLSEAPSVPVSCRVARQRRARVLRDWLLPRGDEVDGEHSLLWKQSRNNGQATRASAY